MNRIFIAIICFLLLSLSSSSQVIYRGHDLNQVALTFDDGPSMGFTEKILDILKKENVKATFFVIGEKAYQYPYILKQISDGGHDIGNHTYYHSRVTWLSDEKLLGEIKRTSDVVNKITGKETKFFRPPFGTITPERKRLIEKDGYTIVMWYGNADDFYHIGWGMRSPKSITKRILSQLKGGNIILMHDDSKQIIEALPEIIKEIRKRGYRFVTLSELKTAAN